MTHCLYIPLDGRPCNARFPIELAQLAGIQVRTPETRLLGNAKTPAALKALDHWLAAACEASPPDTEILLFVSLETWLYGNLVASRKSTQSLANVLDRLHTLEALRSRYPQLKIYALATLLRLSNSNDDTEERPYWKTHGKQIYRYSWLEHYLSHHHQSPEQREGDPHWQEFKALQEAIPDTVRADYKALRARNFTVLEAVVKGLQSGWIEQCLLGCDDGGTYGWNVQERERLLQYQKELNLEQQWLIYPGADELGSVLMARALIPEQHTLQLQWTHPEAQVQVTRYEGIPLTHTLRAQAHAAGITLKTDTTADSAGVLWLHNPPLAADTSDPHNQIDQFLDRETRVPVTQRAYEHLSHALHHAKTPVMVADVLYANGGDAALLSHLEHTQALFQLSGYAAWNTTGNTLGYLLAWFKFYLKYVHPSDTRRQNQHLKILMERLADDGLYQGEWRQQWCQHYTDPVTLDTCVQGIYAFNQRFRQWRDTYAAIAAGGAPQVKQLSFPWRRFFEVDLQICWPETCESESA